MPRRLIAATLLALGSVASAQAPPVNEFDIKLLKFHESWTAFVAEWAGCDMPQGVNAFEAVPCRPMLGQLNRYKLDQAKKRGLAFFALIED